MADKKWSDNSEFVPQTTISDNDNLVGLTAAGVNAKFSGLSIRNHSIAPLTIDTNGNINNNGTNPVTFNFSSDFSWFGNQGPSFGYTLVAGLGAHAVSVGVGNILFGHYSTSSKSGCFIFSDSTATSSNNHYPSADNQALFYASGGFGIGAANNSPQAGFHYGYSFGNDGKFLFSGQGPVTTSNMASKEINPYVDIESFKIQYKGDSGTAYTIILPSGTAATLSADNVMTGNNKFSSLTTNGNFYNFKNPAAINASRTLTASDIITRHLYAISSTASPITLDFGTAATLLSGLNAVSSPVVGSTIPLRIFNGSSFPLTITNTTDTANFITLSLGSGIVAPNSSIDLEFNLASISTPKFFVSGVSQSSTRQIVKAYFGNAYTVLASDVGSKIYTTNASPVTITVPAVLNVGETIQVYQAGVGQVSFVGSGITFNSPVGASPKISALYGSAEITNLLGTTAYNVNGLITS